MGKKYQTFARREKRLPSHSHLFVPSADDSRLVPLPRKRISRIMNIRDIPCPSCARRWEGVSSENMPLRNEINAHILACLNAEEREEKLNTARARHLSDRKPKGGD